jgi:hypothetical protein
MPLAALASQTGSLQAEESSNAALAQLGDQRLEARTRGKAAGRAAQVVINRDDVAEAVVASQVRERIRAALALQVVLDLHEVD